MGVAIHLARCALHEDVIPAHAPGAAAAWIGSRCWPLPRALIGEARDGALLQRSLFIDAPDRAARLWAIDLALRSSAVGVVIADGSGLDMASTRRLQLAARSSGAIGLLLRPGHEAAALSAAQTRWLVQPARAHGRRPRWMVELVRRKGGALPARPPRLLLEWDHETGALVVAPDVAGRSVAQKARRTA